MNDKYYLPIYIIIIVFLSSCINNDNKREPVEETELVMAFWNETNSTLYVTIQVSNSTDIIYNKSHNILNSSSNNNLLTITIMCKPITHLIEIHSSNGLNFTDVIEIQKGFNGWSYEIHDREIIIPPAPSP